MAEGGDEERDSRRKKNVSSGSRAGEPKKETESSTTRDLKALDTEERLECELQKGSDEGSDEGSDVEFV